MVDQLFINVFGFERIIDNYNNNITILKCSKNESELALKLLEWICQLMDWTHDDYRDTFREAWRLFIELKYNNPEQSSTRHYANQIADYSFDNGLIPSYVILLSLYVQEFAISQ